MDSLGLFTHGEFLEYDNADPELLLYTHGEFPRPSIAEILGGVGADEAAVGTGRRRRVREPQIVRPDDAAAIAIALTLADDDDWW